MVRIITDSTSSIPQDIRAELGIEVTSLIINRNGEELVESETNLDAFYKDIYEMADNIPTSSQPPLGKVREVVESIAKTGDEVLGIFISSKMSGTFESFAHTAKEVKNDLPNFRFAAIDSMTNCMEMGWPAIAAAKAAKTGASLDDCIQAANTSLHSTRFVFAPESLLFLQKGGRIGKAAALIGNMISLTPVLTVNDGEASTFSKCRTQKKALAKMLQVLGEDTAPSGLKNLVVHYIGSKAPAVKWAEEKVAPLIGFMPRVVPASPVIGVHVGPA
ncbi:DegV family protein, partial [Slackia isoflavoniconvertens]|uniref:DegV family protein n=1 Tax=Slackia isoflavoniconvertens TaxID=572010 RepID=UPI003AB955FC